MKSSKALGGLALLLASSLLSCSYGDIEGEWTPWGRQDHVVLVFNEDSSASLTRTPYEDPEQEKAAVAEPDFWVTLGKCGFEGTWTEVPGKRYETTWSSRSTDPDCNDRRLRFVPNPNGFTVIDIEPSTVHGYIVED